LGGRDQEDHSSKSAWANSSQDPISKIPNTKQGWWSVSNGRALDLEFKLQYYKKKNVIQDKEIT
jgi:hypothetical protein